MKHSLFTHIRFTAALICLICCVQITHAQKVDIIGEVTDKESNRPIEFASILLKDVGLWAISNAEGRFTIKDAPLGEATLIVQCLGYRTRNISVIITQDLSPIHIDLFQESLKLSDVTVLARRKSNETTTYTIEHTALENQQILNIGNVSSLLPGGKTVNPSLINDERMALRSGNQEKGNASFGTAIEIDGMRMDNNASPHESMAASTRSVGVSNIESVEIITGIPSVEYGDLSNGVVKINTRKGKSPFIVEGKINQHTRQIAVNKGFELGHKNGVLNVSLEHARSFSDAASPHTAYQRNYLSLHYMNAWMTESMPLTFNLGLTGNLGGYNSKSDPDEELDDYSKARDNRITANAELNWLLNKKWITNISLRGSFSTSDRKSENYIHNSSASTQPYIHTLSEGYFIAREYDDSPTANIILSPTGYWHVRSYHDSKPLNYSLRLKADWTHRFNRLLHHLMIGAEYTGNKNRGRGTYYEDMRYAPTWREYKYDNLPTLNNFAWYIEDKLSLPTSSLSLFEVTAGIREDVTIIKGSEYGNVASFSPRFNGRYIFWREQKQRWVNELTIHGGWGKSVKLPSFQVFYPSPSYRDVLAFSSPSTSNNSSFYAYYTHPSSAVYNPELKWQYTNQVDIGFDMNIQGTRISVSAFHHRTYHPYMATAIYTPFAYQYTPPSSLNGIPIELSNRIYDVNEKTGLVTVSDATGNLQPVTLQHNTRRTYLSNTKYVNASPIDRYGLEWMIDFATIKPLQTSIRVDGNYYYYKGIDDILFAETATGNMSNGQPYQYIGYYRGSNATSTSYSANASVANGALSKQLNLNTTITTHLPKLRMIIALRLECSLYHFRRSLSEFDNGTRGYELEDPSSYIGTPYNGNSENKYIAIYPEYYSTWENPEERIPFAEKFIWAKDNDHTLYNDLSQLVVRSNYPYTMNPHRLSAYYSANISVTKEIGNHISVSFYANNFFNNLKTVHSSQTDTYTSLFGSSYIPSFYYGLSLRLKI